MKLKSMAVLATILSLGSSIHAESPKVSAGKDGFYWQFHDSIYKDGNMLYGADTKTQVCFVLTSNGVPPNSSTSNFAPIPCENLAKRVEWKSVITWVK